MARRKGPIILVVCAILALGTLAGALAYRAALLEAGLRSALRGRGVPAVALTVGEVGWSQTTVADIALGSGPEVRVRHVRLAYDPADLISGQLKAVEIDGAVVSLNATGDAPVFGSLQPLLDSARGGDGPGDGATVPVPAIRLTNTRIEAETPLGPAVALLAGDVSPTDVGALRLTLDVRLDTDHGWGQGRLDASRAPDGRLTGTLLLEDGALTLPGAEIRGVRGEAAIASRGVSLDSARVALELGTLSLPGVAFEQARLDLEATETAMVAEAALSTADGQLRLSANGRAQGLDSRPILTMDAQAEVTAQAALWDLLGLPAPSAGRATATASLEADLPPRAAWPGANLARVQGDLLDSASGHITIALDDVSYPDLVRGLTGRARIDAAPDTAKHGSLAGQVELNMTIEQASVAELHAMGIALTQSASLRAGPDAAALSATAPGRLSAQSLTYGKALSSEAPIAAAIAALDATIGRGEPAASHAMTLVPDRMRVRLQGATDQALTIQGQAGQVRLSGTYGADPGYEGSVVIEGGDIEVAPHDVAVEGLTATLALAAGALKRVDFAAETLRHRAEPPLVAPVSVSGNARLGDDQVSFEADATGPKGIGRIAIRGSHRPATNAGNLDLTVAPLEFTPGGAQPSDLFPGLSDLRDVAGTAKAGARIAWTAKAIDGSAELAIENMSLTSPAARVEGLSLGLRLDQIQPPGSPPGQTLRIGLLDPGVPLTDLSVRFQVLPDDPPDIAIQAAEVHLAGGRLELADVVIDPSRDQQHLPIRADGLDLAEAFRLLGVEGLSGEGRLSGTIPILVRDSTPSIQDGTLTATEPGLLRVRSEYAKQALAGAGESADLMLRALEDFHYDELAISIDQPAADQARLGITMLGNNPNVLDGYPFRFNINLETDPRKLLAAVQEAYRISNRAIRNLWMFGR